MRVRDLKPVALFLFERAQAAKGKNREGGPGRNFRQEIYVGQVYFGERINCFMRVRDLKPAALFLFERAQAAKGKNREGGPGRNFRQEIYVGQVYFGERINCFMCVVTYLPSYFFYLHIFGNDCSFVGRCFNDT